MFAVLIVLFILAFLGLVVSTLAMIYPFGRFRTRRRALRAALACFGLFILSPIIGAVAGIKAPPPRAAAIAVPATNIEASPADAPVLETAQASAVPPVISAPAVSPSQPPALQNPEPASIASNVEMAGTEARDDVPSEPTIRLWSEDEKDRLVIRVMDEEWEGVAGEIVRAREQGTELSPDGLQELEDLVVAMVTPVPASDPRRNLAGYRLLAALRPESEPYTAKVAQYEGAAEEHKRSLLTNLRVEEDQVEGVTWFHHPNEPRYMDSDTQVYLYIGRRGDGRPWLRMRTNYTASDWLFVHTVKVHHDGYTEVLTEGAFERDNDTEIWEWRDETPTDYQLLVLRDVSRATEAILRFEGDQYRRDVTVTSAEKRAIADMLEVYAILREG